MPIVIAVIVAIVVAIGALVGLQLPELRRYLKMRKM
jgi:predicted membrane-bound spermidine synthase